MRDTIKAKKRPYQLARVANERAQRIAGIVVLLLRAIGEEGMVADLLQLLQDSSKHLRSGSFYHRR